MGAEEVWHGYRLVLVVTPNKKICNEGYPNNNSLDRLQQFGAMSKVIKPMDLRQLRSLQKG